jgi:hypothetical protein
MQVKETEQGLVLRISRGEYAMEQLYAFARSMDVPSAFLSGLGAVDSATFGYYDIASREYTFTTVEEPLEVASLNGNITQKEGEPIVHVHAVFGDQQMQARAGHVDEMRVAVVLEVHVTPLGTAIERAHDDETGLSLMQLNDTHT